MHTSMRSGVLDVDVSSALMRCGAGGIDDKAYMVICTSARMYALKSRAQAAGACWLWGSRNA